MTSNAALESLRNRDRVVFEPAPDLFPRLPEQKPDDWLVSHPEKGQDFEAFVRHCRHRGGPVAHGKILIVPLDKWPPDRSPPLEILRAYALAFFSGLEVTVTDPISLEGHNVSSRINPSTKKRQLLVQDIFHVLGTKLPHGVFCVMAITLDDLYPGSSWNFVFGEAHLEHRVGVFSFARYDPLFYGHMRGPQHMATLIKRCCKVMVHEICHMFGIRHCVFYHCIMNGSNHLGESDARPMFLCPVDLRKLQACIQFDPVRRYRLLLEFFERYQSIFTNEADWCRRRLQSLPP